MRARLFCVGVGSDARHRVMEHLSRAGGGRYLRVDEADASTAQALQLAALIKTPTVTDLEVDLGAGLESTFRLVIVIFTRRGTGLARSNASSVANERDRSWSTGEKFERAYKVSTTTSVVTPLVPRFWAGAYARSLLGSGESPDAERSKVLELGLTYELMTPFTSILALHNEQAYQQQGIQRSKSPLRGVHLTSIQNPADEKRMVALYLPTIGATAGCNDHEAPKANASPTSYGIAPQPQSESAGKKRSDGVARATPLTETASPPPPVGTLPHPCRPKNQAPAVARQDVNRRKTPSRKVNLS